MRDAPPEQIMADNGDRRRRTDADGVLVRAFRVLACFSEDAPELTALELAERTGLALSTVHRLLAQLIELRAVERTSEHHYALGMAVWELGELSYLARGIREKAVPHLTRLYEATGEAVHLAVLDAPTPADATALLVARVAGRRSSAAAARTGRRYPLHATAVGKVLLSTRTGKWLGEYLAEPLVPRTPRSIVTGKALLGELARVRSRAFATTVDEMRTGTSSVAARVKVPDGMPPAALGIVVPTTGVGEPGLATLVMRTARDLGRELTESAGR
jgi:DNA-binding IclR family transcriptional regulator